MRVAFFCPQWEPTGPAPSPTDQLDERGVNNVWSPPRCQFRTTDGANLDWQNTHNWEWGQTGADVARQVRCITHGTRPRGYLRSARAEEHWRSAMHAHYEEIYVRPAEFPGLHERFADLNIRYRPYWMRYWRSIRPPARTSHTNWQ